VDKSKELFAAIDTDDSGGIDLQELKNALGDLGISPGCM
jgi:Ca2+-binding EF-hand superfamily protein